MDKYCFPVVSSKRRTYKFERTCVDIVFLGSSENRLEAIIIRKKKRAQFSDLIGNRTFPSCLKPLFQSEAKNEAVDMKMIFYFQTRKTRFHKKGLTLILSFETRKSPI